MREIHSRFSVLSLTRAIITPVCDSRASFVPHHSSSF